MFDKLGGLKGLFNNLQNTQGYFGLPDMCSLDPLTMTACVYINQYSFCPISGLIFLISGLSIACSFPTLFNNLTYSVQLFSSSVL